MFHVFHIPFHRLFYSIRRGYGKRCGRVLMFKHIDPLQSLVYNVSGARGSVVGWGTMLQAGRSSVWVPDEADFFNWPKPTSRTMAMGSIQPLTEMSTRKFPGGKGSRSAGLTTLPPSVSRMSENVGPSTSHSPKGFLHGLYRNSFTFL
jgi:hypothetical protein